MSDYNGCTNVHKITTLLNLFSYFIGQMVSWYLPSWKLAMTMKMHSYDVNGEVLIISKANIEIKWVP